MVVGNIQEKNGLLVAEPESINFTVAEGGILISVRIVLKSR